MTANSTTSSAMLDKLSQYRTPILLAEIGALLHLLGRFSKEFIISQAKDAEDKDATDKDKKFDYKKICGSQDFFDSTGLDKLLKDNIWNSLIKKFDNLSDAGELSSNPINNFCDFIEKHTWRDGPKGICKILSDAHGIVSGIDKALAGRGSSGKQSIKYTFIATAFGYEREIEFLKKPEFKRSLFEKIKKSLESIKNANNISYEIYNQFSSTIKDFYSLTIGETRRPINEISLYDYAYSIASLVKSNLAKMIIDGWDEPKGKSKWRILKINLDVIGLLSKGLKIGDILGYQNELAQIYEEIKKIVEFSYPIGNEIYRDSTGIYFSCPDVSDIEKLQKELLEKLRGIDRLDFSLQIDISQRSRSMVILASEREKASKDIFFPHVGYLERLNEEFVSSLNDREKMEICPVCMIRLKFENEDRCEKCKERFEKRGKDWVKEPSNQTIWLDEVSDKNDRVALVVGQFDLRKWLSGEFVDTFVSQAFCEWRKENSCLCESLKINVIEDLENQFKQMFSQPQNLNNNQKNLCNSFIGIQPNNFLIDFWEPIAERDATGKASDLTGNGEKAKYLIKLLFRKHPSFARIRRVWETTQKFIDETIFENILTRYSWESETRRKRIQFKIEPNPNITEGSACDIDIGGIRLSPVCIDENNSLFVTTTNLQILSNKGNTIDKIVSRMNGKKIKIKKESESKWQDGYCISSASQADSKFQDYLPYIPIYEFPDQFMALVPAYDALEIAKKIVEEYEIQFSKVRDRLPFHLGIIAFHRRTPLNVVMDAGERLINAFRANTYTTTAKVESISQTQDCPLGKCVVLQLNEVSCSSVPLVWQISYSTEDPCQEDEWHPYIRIEGGNPNSGNYSFDYTGNGDYVVHVKELKPGDVIKIEPSYFKITFIENASDRFRIDENLRPLDDIKRLGEIWDDLQGIVNSKGIGIAQIYAYWQEVKKRCEEYKGDSVWEGFVKSSLTNIFNLSPTKDSELFNKLFQATKDDLLDLCLYWNLQVRKIKPEKGGKNV